MLTIVVCDSRGRYLDTMIDREDILVSYHSGATLHKVALEAINIMTRFKPDTLLIMAGINDMTIMDRVTRKVRPVSLSVEVLVNHVTTRINQAKSMILSSNPNVNIVVGGIIGIDLNCYNGRMGVSPVQNIVDNAIIAINANIRQINIDSGLPYPRLTSKVHTWRKGMAKHLYSRLRDGLHPGDLILENWAHQIRVLHDSLSKKNL